MNLQIKQYVFGLYAKLQTKLGFVPRRLCSTPELNSVLDILKKLNIGKHDTRGLIRVGGDTDGGYYVPEEIFSIDVLISPGIGPTIDFDRAFIDKKIHTILIDKHCSHDLSNLNNVELIQSYLAPELQESMGGFISLEKVIDRYAASANLVALQMDIEGAEWEILDLMPKNYLDRINYIVVELHDFWGLIDRELHIEKARVINKLLKNYDVCYAIENSISKSIPFKGYYIPEMVELTLKLKPSEN
jgi:hypothetical protein